MCRTLETVRLDPSTAPVNTQLAHLARENDMTVLRRLKTCLGGLPFADAFYTNTGLERVCGSNGVKEGYDNRFAITFAPIPYCFEPPNKEPSL